MLRHHAFVFTATHKRSGNSRRVSRLKVDLPAGGVFLNAVFGERQNTSITLDMNKYICRSHFTSEKSGIQGKLALVSLEASLYCG